MKDEELTFQEFFADFPKKFPYIDEPEEPTMDKKLIINVATTGAFLSKEANPNQAFTPQEIANEVIDSYKAGAAMWHVHCRDEQGRATSEPEIIKKTCDMVFEQAPDVITSVSVWSALGKHGADLISPLIDALLVHGKKYTQTAVIPASSLVVGPLVNRIDRETLTSIAEYLNAKEVKPEFQGFTFEAIENIRKFLVEPGIIQPPYYPVELYSGLKL